MVTERRIHLNKPTSFSYRGFGGMYDIKEEVHFIEQTYKANVNSIVFFS